MKRQLEAGLIAAVLGLASLAPSSHATANDSIDMTTTGSVSASATAPAADTLGSETFRNLLGELSGGDPVAIFDQASQLTNAIERLTLQWAAVNYNAGKIDFRAIAKLAEEAPDFASTATYQTRIEQSLGNVEVAANDVVAALGAGSPRTIDGQILLASAYLEQGDSVRAAEMATRLWVDNFLSEAQEAAVIGAFGTLLNQQAHWDRAVHLMMHDRARGSERLLPYLTEAQQGLVNARAAVSRKGDDAKALLDSVDPSLQQHPVYIFSRVQRARQFELWSSAAEWLAKAPDELPDADEWWYERRTLVRKLLDLGQPALAYQVAAGYGNGSAGRVVDAQFHAGWIALSFLNDAAAARGHFAEMARHATLADTISQSNYWLARANLKLGDVEAARTAFAVSAVFGSVYYGQLARAELGARPVEIRPLPDQAASETVFNANRVVKAVRLLAANGRASMASSLLRNFSDGLRSGGDLTLAARLAEEIGAQHLSVAIGGVADRQGIALDDFSFPKATLPENAQLAADRAAVFAVTRQESMFQIDAVSSAGARGLMQLMPGTAEEVARKLGLDYSPNRLVTDAAYNTLLGSTYLATQLDRYQGSLVLAAAAYNAGPGNADKWIRAYGDPRQANVDPVIWVELIPFQETRTYVKRVLGNYLVYRERLGDSSITLQQALRTIR